MPEPIVVDIARLGAQGDGIAEGPDGAIFVPGALPGERAEIELAGSRTRLTGLQRTSPERVVPPCPHFGRCGGCVAQHMSQALYAGWKRDVVVQAFAHRGLEPAVDELVAIEPGSRRRIVLEAKRGPDGIVLGFHAAGSHDLIALQDCHVMLPELREALPGLRQLAGVLLPGAGLARLSVTATATGLDVSVPVLPAAPGAQQRAELGRLAASLGIARITVEGDLVLLRARPLLRLTGAEVELPPGDFIQASAAAEANMVQRVVEAVGRAKRIADLFAGLGTFTFPLARKGRVLAIDSAAPAIAALQQAAARAPGLKPIETRVRDLVNEPLSRKELEPFEAVVLDPPRAGALAQAEALARSQVPVVVAVSCNPATLARDARCLVDGGYSLDSVTPIDQFVWSAHIEAVAVLRRERRSGRRER